jgi:tetratricopeptide (TPR) repeat protein
MTDVKKEQARRELDEAHRLQALGEYEAALKHLNICLDLDPDNPQSPE